MQHQSTRAPPHGAARADRRVVDRLTGPFRWGVATSAYQIEGAVAEDGRTAVDLGHLLPGARRRRRTATTATSPATTTTGCRPTWR